MAKLKREKYILSFDERLSKILINQGYYQDYQILTINNWLTQLYQKIIHNNKNYFHYLNFVPINEFVSNLIWSEVLSTLKIEGEQLYSFDKLKLLEVFSQDRKLVKEYQISIDDLYQNQAQDLVQAVRVYDQFLNDHHYIDQYQQLIIIDQYITSKDYHKDFFEGVAQIYLFGFNDLQPLYQNFFSTIANTEIQIKPFSEIQPTSSKQPISECKYVFENEYDEYYHISDWLNNAIEKKMRVNLIVPDLYKNWQTSLFKLALFPLTKHKSKIEDYYKIFNFAGGITLMQYPLIKELYLLIKLAFYELEIDELITLIKSDYLFANENSKSALVKFFYDRHYMEIVNLDQIIQFIDDKINNEQKNHSTIIKCFSHIKQMILYEPKKQINENFIVNDLISLSYQIIESISIKGEEPHQILLNKLINAINTINQISVFKPKISKVEFIEYLSIVLQNNKHQIPSENSQINIIDFEEASNIEADETWLCKVDANAFNSNQIRSSYLNKKLQEKYQIKELNFDLRQSYNQAILTNIKNYSSQIIYSYSQKENIDTTEHPFLQNVEQKEFLDEVQAHEPKNLFEQANQYQVKSIKNRVKGNSRLFDDAHNCLFKAYATTRLKLKDKYEKNNLFIANLNLGNIFHYFFEHFFKKYPQQNHWINLNKNQFDKNIKEILRQSIEKEQEKNTDFDIQIVFNSLYLQILDWLEIEKSRHEFKSIHQEFSVSFTYKNIDFNLKIDRIDEFYGKKIIIDYKLKKNALSSTIFPNKEKINNIATQLILYNIAWYYTYHYYIENLGYAVLDPKEQLLYFKGENPFKYTNIPSIKELNLKAIIDIDALMDKVNQLFEQCMNQFLEGNISINPNRHNCMYCNFKNLCRYSVTYD